MAQKEKLTLNLTSETVNQLRQLAEMDQKSMSGWIVDVIVREARERNVQAIKLDLKKSKIDKANNPNPAGRQGMTKQDKWGKERAENIHQWLKDQHEMWGKDNPELYERDYKPYGEWVDLMERKRNYRAIFDFWETRPLQKENRPKSLAFVLQQLSELGQNPS
jgi:uncharacterized protein (DUF1778 family)